MSSQRYISDTLKRKKNKVKKIKLYIILFFTVVFLGVFVYLTQLKQIQISDIKIFGNVFVYKREIENKANSVLNKKIFGFIPKRNFYFFSAEELEKEIKKNPAIISVKIRTEFPNSLFIEIEEQEKEMIYCTSVEHVDCLYINKTGFIYARVNDFIIPEQEVILYNEQGSQKITDVVMNENVYKELSLFIKNLTRQEIRVGEVYLKKDGVVELVTREKSRIITSIYDDYQKDFSNFLALFDKEVIKKNELNNFEYFDLRFGNKVYYKNKTN